MEVTGYVTSWVTHLGSGSRRTLAAMALCTPVLIGGCSSNQPPAVQATSPVATNTTPPPATTPGGTATAGAAGLSRVTSSTAGTTAGSGTTTTAMTGGTGTVATTGAGTSGSAGKAGSGGTSTAQAGNSGSGGSSINSRRQAAMDEDAGVCMPPTTKPNLSMYKKCSMDICPAQDSICMPISTLRVIASQQTQDLLANCDANSKCVPLALAEGAGKSLLTTCKSLVGAEGRCISPCVPQVATLASVLPKDVCTGTDLCAPCYDPRTGEDTHACDQGCDPGPKEKPIKFTQCCGDRGLCVPPALAGAQAKNLNKEACAGDTLCAPKELADLTFKPKACDSLEGAEGRCISTCVGGAVAKQKDRLPTAGCSTGEVCAPCYDPVTGESTGACEVNGDKPTKPKLVFQPCCGMAGGQPVGVCVPPSLAGDQASILRQESCPSGKLCAPIKKAIDPAYKFPACSGLGTGACVNKCIPDPAQASILGRATCAASEVCAPCSLLGQETGVCK